MILKESFQQAHDERHFIYNACSFVYVLGFCVSWFLFESFTVKFYKNGFCVEFTLKLGQLLRLSLQLQINFHKNFLVVTIEWPRIVPCGIPYFNCPQNYFWLKKPTGPETTGVCSQVISETTLHYRVVNVVLKVR